MGGLLLVFLNQLHGMKEKKGGSYKNHLWGYFLNEAVEVVWKEEEEMAVTCDPLTIQPPFHRKSSMTSLPLTTSFLAISPPWNHCQTSTSKPLMTVHLILTFWVILT